MVNYKQIWFLNPAFREELPAWVKEVSLTHVEGWERVVEKIDGRYAHVGRTIEYHYWARQARSKWFEYTHVIGKPSFYQVLIDVLTLTGEKNFEDNFVPGEESVISPIFSNKHWLLCINNDTIMVLRPQIGVAIENYRWARFSGDTICLVYEPMDPAAIAKVVDTLMLGRRPRPAEPEQEREQAQELPTSEIEIIEIGETNLSGIQFDDYEYGLLGAVDMEDAKRQQWRNKMMKLFAFSDEFYTVGCVRKKKN
ncbi:hypothetical protein SPFM1_00046 [Salmonella phage SPFM1]|nr:hypothetical protein SPFM1_00046 [Salmonella phage SPFM1]